MRVINKKIVITILVILEICSIYLMYKSYNNKNLLEDKIEEPKKEKLVIKVDNGNGEYVYSTDLPGKGYELNKDLTECIDIEGNKVSNPKITSDGESVTITSKYTNYCTLYFDEVDNLIKDLSGNKNNGLSYAVDWNEEGLTTSNEQQFGYVDCGLANHDFEDSITYIARIKINSTRYGHIISNHEGAGIALVIGNNILSLSVNSASDNKYYGIQTPLNDLLNEFITIVGVYGKDGMSIYVNGDKKVSGESYGNIKISRVPIFIGDNPGSYVTDGNPLLATYSDVLIFDTALTDTEIKEYFNGEINKDKVISNYVNNNKDKKLLLYYRFI